MNKIANLKITNSNGTYLLENSILPAFLNEEGQLYVVEEYEKGNPCEHTLQDLLLDGITFSLLPL